MSAERAERPGGSPGLRGAEAAGLILALGALGLLGGRAPEPGRPGDGGGEGDAEQTPLLCGEEHGSSGETQPLDLPGVERAYRDLRMRLERTRSAAPAPLGSEPGRPGGEELPACRGAAQRSEAFPASRGLRIRGRVLVFLSGSAPDSVRRPPGLPEDADAEFLLLGVRSLQDLPGIEQRLGRSVSLATAALARALGVRCLPTWIRIREAGDVGELHEGD